MRGNFRAFNGLVRTELVNHGSDYKFPDGDHLFTPVYSAMMLQISRDYNGLPDVRSLKTHQIKFFYEGLRDELKRDTKPK